MKSSKNTKIVDQQFQVENTLPENYLLFRDGESILAVELQINLITFRCISINSIAKIFNKVALAFHCG